MEINCLVLNTKDSVAVALNELKKDDHAVYKTPDGYVQITVKQGIPTFHKISLSAVKKGEPVYKYGQIIGKAIEDIEVGQHVHTHNLTSIREDIDD